MERLRAIACANQPPAGLLRTIDRSDATKLADVVRSIIAARLDSEIEQVKAADAGRKDDSWGKCWWNARG